MTVFALCKAISKEQVWDAPKELRKINDTEIHDLIKLKVVPVKVDFRDW